MLRDGEVGGRAGKNRRADVMSMGDVADDGERPSKKTVGEFQVAVQNGFANARTADWLAIHHDTGDDGDIDSMWLA